MALGIDIYRYQVVNDWSAVRNAGVTFVYVKGTDGGGPAIARADGQVHGAQGVGLPVGLYHYAQLSPSPEIQADVLTAEVRRLVATGMSPALDLESPFAPNSAARQFAQRFLNRLHANGFGTKTLYANTSMLSGIGADTLGVPGVRIWAANYGVNNGVRHGYSYGGHVDIHQYTSVGRVPGISGSVDMNESLTPLVEDTMSEADAWNGVANLIRSLARDEGKEIRKILVDIATEGGWDGVSSFTKDVGGDPDVKIALHNIISEVIAPLKADIAELKARPVATATVDAHVVAQELIAAGLSGGASQAQVAEVVRQAFAKAATP